MFMRLAGKMINGYLSTFPAFYEVGNIVHFYEIVGKIVNGFYLVSILRLKRLNFH